MDNLKVIIGVRRTYKISNKNLRELIGVCKGVFQMTNESTKKNKVKSKMKI